MWLTLSTGSLLFASADPTGRSRAVVPPRWGRLTPASKASHSSDIWRSTRKRLRFISTSSRTRMTQTLAIRLLVNHGLQFYLDLATRTGMRPREPTRAASAALLVSATSFAAQIAKRSGPAIIRPRGKPESAVLMMRAGDAVPQIGKDSGCGQQAIPRDPDTSTAAVTLALIMTY